MAGYNPAVRVYPYDQAKARELYTRSGLTATISIMVPSPTNRFWELFNNAVADSPRNTLGVSVMLQVVTPFRALVDAVRAGHAALYMFGWASDPVTSGIRLSPSVWPTTTTSPIPRSGRLWRSETLRPWNSCCWTALIVPIIHYVSQ